MTRLPARWTPPVADRQLRLFSAEQAWAAGATRRQVQIRLASGAWVHHLGDAIGLRDLAASPARAITAIGLTWPHAVACLTTAARFHGLPVPHDAEEHALVGRRTRSRGGVRMHLRPIRADETLRVGPGTVTSRSRTVLDCIGFLPVPASERLAAWCVTRELVDADRLEQAVEERRRRWGTAGLRRAAADARAGTLSVAERRLRAIIRQAGITGCAFDQKIVDEAGIVGRADALFARERLVIEVDGFEYHARAQFQADRDKQNRLIAAGFTVLRFTWADLTRRPDYVAAQVVATLAALRAR